MRCTEQDHCAKAYSNYCIKCRIITDDTNDEDYFFKEHGD